ncbi:hypothetical protein ACFX50_07060 [Neisseria meningitidis]
MHTHKVERVLVLNEKDELKGLITVKDILKTTEFPNANKDSEGRLRCRCGSRHRRRHRRARQSLG